MNFGKLVLAERGGETPIPPAHKESVKVTPPVPYPPSKIVGLCKFIALQQSKNYFFALLMPMPSPDPSGKRLTVKRQDGYPIEGIGCSVPLGIEMGRCTHPADQAGV